MSSGSYYEEEMSSGGHRRLTAFILWPFSPSKKSPLDPPSPWSWLGAYTSMWFLQRSNHLYVFTSVRFLIVKISPHSWYKTTNLLLRSSLVGRLLRLRQLTFVICNRSETNVRKISDTTKLSFFCKNDLTLNNNFGIIILGVEIFTKIEGSF